MRSEPLVPPACFTCGSTSCTKVCRGSGSEAHTQSPREIQEFDVPAYDASIVNSWLDAAIDADTATDPFPMAGVPVEAVLRRIRQAGGELLLLEDGNRAGPEWLDYRYFVRMPASAVTGSTQGPARVPRDPQA